MMKFNFGKFLTLLGLVVLGNGTAQAQNFEREQVVNAVNKVRKEGCKCGNRYYQPVDEVSWNDTLYTSASAYALLMDQKKFFAHVGPDGKDIGERVEKYGYNWKFIGENLGRGQSDIYELITDWKKSFTHCKLLMDPRFTEMGLASYGGYWVLHLGMKMSK
jgi:uncharacterized protein YkwD